MTKISSVILLIFVVSLVGSAHAQDELNMELVVTDEQRIVLFAGFIIAVIAIFLYLARDIIFQKKTEYDKEDLESKRNKDYEKYHSDWSDDYEEFGSRSYVKEEKKFKEALGEGTLPDYYKTLGVPQTATPNEIKTKYRELAKKLHPDRTKSNETAEKMSDINKAYEVLSDKELREKYDKYFDLS